MAFNDVLGIIIVIIMVIWLGLSIYAHIQRQSIKESIIELKEWISEKLKKK